MHVGIVACAVGVGPGMVKYFTSRRLGGIKGRGWIEAG